MALGGVPRLWHRVATCCGLGSISLMMGYGDGVVVGGDLTDK